jgi:RND family efflux transporter MFP subunit
MSSERERRGGRGRIVLWLCIIAVAAVFVFRFLQVRGKEAVSSIGSVQQAEGKPVEVVKAAAGDLETWTNLAGTVEGSFQYPIVSANSITVVEVVKHEGDRVKPGDVVIRLETVATSPMLLSYNRSLAVYQDALADLERMRNLYAAGAISKQMLDKSELAADVAKSDLANARESTNLLASHAGIVTSVYVKAGEMADAYKPLAWIARTDSVRVTFAAGSRQAAALRVGQKAVWESGTDAESVTGAVSKVDLSADPTSRLINGEALFPNPDRALVPGTLIPFRVRTGERQRILKIPVDCLIETKGRYRVYVAEQGEGGKTFARLRDVTTGLRTTDEIEIMSGVKVGERVVEFGQTLLSDGDLIKIVRSRGGK